MFFLAWYLQIYRLRNSTHHSTEKEDFMAAPSVPQEKIAKKAYEIFMSRGAKPGNELDDWLQAEKELLKHGQNGSIVSFQTKRNRNGQGQGKYSY
jgi:hypothetical protein